MYIEGITSLGLIKYDSGLAENSKEMYVFQRNWVSNTPRRVGYAYFFYDSQINNRPPDLLERFPVYFPSTVQTVRSELYAPTRLCKIMIEWDVEGLDFGIYF